MTCPHCGEELDKILCYQQVTQITEISLVNDEPYVEGRLVIEYPAGHANYRFRCGCGGDLSSLDRFCRTVLKKNRR